MDSNNAFDNEMFEQMFDEMLSSSRKQESSKNSVKEKKIDMSKPKKTESSIRLISHDKSVKSKKYSKANELYDITKQGNVIILKRNQKKLDEEARKKSVRNKAEERTKNQKEKTIKEEVARQKNKEKQKNKMVKQISRSLKQRVREEEKIARKEQKKAEKEAKRKKKSVKKFDRSKRFTEPKKRNILSRIILQQRLTSEKYENLRDDYENGYITKENIEFSKNATKGKDKKLYKEVQNYEDAREDVTVRRGWTAFKVGLAAAMLAGSLAIANYGINEIKDTFSNTTSEEQAKSVYELDDEKKINIYSNANNLRQEIIENDGYHFDNLNEDQFVDGYYRIWKYEKELHENTLKNVISKIGNNEDQVLLDEIVEKAFDSDFANIDENQKRDYRQLAFEIVQKIFDDEKNNIRNPIVIDELNAKNNAKTKGYKITLIVNNDEEETVKNLGNIMHTLNEMQDTQYKTTSQIENGQEKFWKDILITSIGEEKYNELSDKEKRDYKQIAYEWLSDDAKQYIQDPVELEKTNDMEIGE